ncbi:hypothetical protein SAMN06298212_10569 [Ruaniaceae bacterium KH17]|nr:hypothetical protein SAMN06298212_10569 [Ruaniaceae bacterium KH17]
MSTTTELAPIHPLVQSMPSKVLFGRSGSALIWLEANREPGQVMPLLDDLARERERRTRASIARMFKGTEL